jgi:hypothetical protein
MRSGCVQLFDFCLGGNRRKVREYGRVMSGRRRSPPICFCWPQLHTVKRCWEDQSDNDDDDEVANDVDEVRGRGARITGSRLGINQKLASW